MAKGTKHPANDLIPHRPVDKLIHVIREKKAILDTDLAAIYGLAMKPFNPAIERNAARYPNDISRLKPSSATIYLIALAELLSEQFVFSESIPRLQWYQNDQKQQDIPAMHCKCDPANSHIDKQVHGVLQTGIQSAGYQIICLWSHRKRLA
jgi:hypothetical protein